MRIYNAPSTKPISSLEWRVNRNLSSSMQSPKQNNNLPTAHEVHEWVDFDSISFQNNIKAKLYPPKKVDNSNVHRTCNARVESKFGDQIHANPTCSTSSPSECETILNTHTGTTDSLDSFHINIDLVTQSTRPNDIDYDEDIDDDNLTKSTSSTISTRSVIGKIKSAKQNPHSCLLSPLIEEDDDYVKDCTIQKNVIGTRQSGFAAVIESQVHKNHVTSAASLDISFDSDDWQFPYSFDKISSSFDVGDKDVTWHPFTPSLFKPIEQPPSNKLATNITMPKPERCTRKQQPETTIHGLVQELYEASKCENKTLQKEISMRKHKYISSTSPSTSNDQLKKNNSLTIIPQICHIRGNIGTAKEVSTSSFDRTVHTNTCNVDGPMPKESVVFRNQGTSSAIAKSNLVQRRLQKNNKVALNEMIQSKRIGMSVPNTRLPMSSAKVNFGGVLTVNLSRNRVPLCSGIHESSSPAPDVLTSGTKCPVETISSSFNVQNAGPLDNLSDDEFVDALNNNPDLIKYSKMSKVGLPISIIQHAMQRDGVTLPSREKNAASTNTPEAIFDPIQRLRIPWSTHTNIRTNTIWAMIQREQHWLTNVTVDPQDMTNMFQKMKRPLKLGNRSTVPPLQVKKCVIDPKRANNCGIILANLKHLSYQDIALAIHTMNIDIFTLTQLRSISEFLPTTAERVVLQQRLDESSTPVKFQTECEGFMVEIIRVVVDATQKMDAMIFMKQLPDCLKELTTDFISLRQVSEQIMNSCSLRKIIGLILHIGNKINNEAVTDGLSSEAVAIELSSLSTIESMKGYDTNHTNFLQYIVQKLYTETPHIMQIFRNEFISNTTTTNGSTASTGSKSRQDTRTVLTLHSSKRLNTTINQYPESVRNLHNINNQFEKLRLMIDDADDRTVEIAKICQFIDESIEPIRNIIDEYNSTCHAFDRILNYFGEDNNIISSHSRSEVVVDTIYVNKSYSAETTHSTRTALPVLVKMNVTHQNAALVMIQHISEFVVQVHEAVVKLFSCK